MKKKIWAILISALFLIGLMPAAAFAGNWNPSDEITIKVRIFNPDNGGTWVVGTDTCTKGDKYVQSDDYTIPQLSKFIGENSYRVQFVAGNWYFPAGDRNVGSIVNWSCNSSEATMTYWVPGYTPAGSTGGGSSGSDTEESGSGNYSMTYKIIYHSNYPGGTDYTQEYNYIIRAGYNIGNTGRTVSVKTVAQLGFTAPSGYALASTPWNKQADGKGDGVNSTVYVTPNSTTHLYAQWIPDEVSTKVTLKYMNGDEQYGETQSYLAGDKVNVINCTAEKPGFVFKGWDTNAVASNVVYEADDQFVINANTVLYAVWEAQTTYTVTYTDGVNGEAFADQVYSGLLSGANTPLFNGKPEREGYVFGGWNPAIAETVTGDATYVATWKEDKNNNGIADDEEQKYTVKYTDGVDDEEVFADQVYSDLLSGTATPLFNGKPEREGYVFGGWNPAIADTVTGDATYVATWKEDKNNNGIADDEEKKYTVKYTDGANGTIFEDQIYENLLVGTPIPAFKGTPKRTGYVFAGWDPEMTDVVKENVTYTPVWKEDKNNNGIADDEEDKYTVVYTDGVDDEEVFADQIYRDLLSGTATPAFNGKPEREGYTFVGWNPAVTDIVKENAVYTAVWEKIPETGDSSDLMLWFVIMLAAGIAMAGTVVCSRKKNAQR